MGPKFPDDIYTEPASLDGKTLAKLGPLRRMASLWRGEQGVDVKPKAQGPKTQVYVEYYELQLIDPQTNGPQVFYGLRYHTFIHKPGLTKMYHDQVGYWLWEPATGNVLHALAIPRGQIAMASGRISPDADRFELTATPGSHGEWHRLQPLPRACLHHAVMAHRGRLPCRRDLVVRAGHGDANPGAGRAFSPHRPQHAHEGGRALAEPA